MNPNVTPLPGEEILRAGLGDLAGDRLTEAALLLLIAAPRLRALGLDIPERKTDTPFEHQLYARLEERLGAAAHSHYNSLIRRVVSLARSLDREHGRRPSAS